MIWKDWLNVKSNVFPSKFNSKPEEIAAYRNGEIGPNDPVEIKEA